MLKQKQWLFHLSASAGLFFGGLPVASTMQGDVCSKEAMVSTFEVLATRCKQPLQSPAGLRLFGGHSARATGARVYAASGLDILNKVRILARHSGDTILRYVGVSSLDNITSELASSCAKS